MKRIPGKQRHGPLFRAYLERRWALGEEEFHRILEEGKKEARAFLKLLQRPSVLPLSRGEEDGN